MKRKVEVPKLSDPFRKLWSRNFHTNLREREFEKERVTSIIQVVRKTKEEKHPVILVNPGPSLEKNIKELKKIYDKRNSIIICSDVCLFRLVDAEIIPDVVVTIDPSNSIARFIEGYEEVTKDIVFSAPTTVATESLKLWKGRICFFNQRDNTKIKDEFFRKLTKKVQSFGGLVNLNFVGGTMIQMAVLLNASEIFLVGWDFCANEKGEFYCQGFLDKRVYTTLKNDNSLKEELEKRSEEFQDEEGKKIKNLLLEDFEKGLKEYKNMLLKREVAKYSQIEMENKETKKKLKTNNSFLLYKKVLLDVIIKDVKVPFYNCTEGGILTEIPQLALKNATDYFSNSTGVKQFLLKAFS